MHHRQLLLPVSVTLYKEKIITLSGKTKMTERKTLAETFISSYSVLSGKQELHQEKKQASATNEETFTLGYADKNNPWKLLGNHQ